MDIVKNEPQILKIYILKSRQEFARSAKKAHKDNNFSMLCTILWETSKTQNDRTQHFSSEEKICYRRKQHEMLLMFRKIRYTDNELTKIKKIIESHWSTVLVILV